MANGERNINVGYAAVPRESVEELRGLERLLGQIEARLEKIEARLSAIEARLK